jgi:hypothetical protein
MLLTFNVFIIYSKPENKTKLFPISEQTIDSPEIETPYIGDYLYACSPYPTPAKEFVNSLVYWDKRYNFNKAEINVFNTEGIKICSKERISISQQSDWSSIVTWNASGFPFGIYIILIKHGSKTISIKVAIE